jgi:DNA replication protein DnaC
MSTNLLLENYLKALRLTTLVDNYRRFAQDAARDKLSYERFLLALVEQEVTHREVARQTRLIRQARFPMRKELSEFDFACVPELNQQGLLHLADSADYISAACPILMLGNPGLGKTHLAISLGLAACRQGYKVRFYNAAALVNDLIQAQQEQRLSKFLASALKHHLVIVDELGFIPFTPTGAQLMFQFCSALHEQVAIIVTTNLAFSDWTQVFGDERLTGALLDRLTFNAHIFEFRGESFRFRQRLRQQTKCKVGAHGCNL